METKNPTSEKINVSKVDSLNLASAKINLSKGKKEILENSKFSKGEKTTSKELYIGTSKMSTDESKIFRRNLRSKLDRFMKNILGQDRTEKERENAIGEFLIFYKENWRIADFKIENFSAKKKEADLRDLKNLLAYVESVIEK